MTRYSGPKYKTEAELCTRFVGHAAEVGWVCYGETRGWDILLVRRADGCQIGVEAKLQLNPEVLVQADDKSRWQTEGPDYRAVLVPSYAVQSHCAYLAARLGITPLIFPAPGQPLTCWGRNNLRPDWPPVNPNSDHSDGQPDSWNWQPQLPMARYTLPEFVPDVTPGKAAPVQLTRWKIGAIKIAILLARHGYVTRADFRSIGIDHRRWISSGASSWLIPDPPRGFKQRDGADMLAAYRREHPKNVAEIEALFDQWKPPHWELLRKA